MEEIDPLALHCETLPSKGSRLGWITLLLLNMSQTWLPCEPIGGGCEGLEGQTGVILVPLYYGTAVVRRAEVWGQRLVVWTSTLDCKSHGMSVPKDGLCWLQHAVVAQAAFKDRTEVFPAHTHASVLRPTESTLMNQRYG